MDKHEDVADWGGVTDDEKEEAERRHKEEMEGKGPEQTPLYVMGPCLYQRRPT